MYSMGDMYTAWHYPAFYSAFRPRVTYTSIVCSFEYVGTGGQSPGSARFYQLFYVLEGPAMAYVQLYAAILKRSRRFVENYYTVM